MWSLCKPAHGQNHHAHRTAAWPSPRCGRKRGSSWSELTDQPFELPKDKTLTLAAYQVEPMTTAYVETVGVGDRLPDMPLFLYDEYGIDVPLEETYQTTWNVLPVEIRQLLETANRS